MINEREKKRERDESLKDEMKERNKKKGSEFIRFFMILWVSKRKEKQKKKKKKKDNDKKPKKFR